MGLGYRALYNQTNGNRNVALGYEALETLTSGKGNIAIGYRTDVSSNQSNTIVIVTNVTASSNNEIHLGNSSHSLFRTPATTVSFTGNLEVGGNTEVDGYVGIGGVSSTYDLYVDSGSDTTPFKLKNDNSDFRVELSYDSSLKGGASDGKTAWLDIEGTEWFLFGDHIIPRVNNTYQLGGSSNRWTAVYASNGTIQTSDKRLKTDITSLNYGLEEVMNLRPVNFRWKSDPKALKLGFIAQEVDKVIPESVDKGQKEGDYLGMNYADIIPVLTKAIQEQQQQIESLQAEVNALKQHQSEEKKKENQQAQIDALKAMVQQLLNQQLKTQ